MTSKATTDDAGKTPEWFVQAWTEWYGPERDVFCNPDLAWTEAIGTDRHNQNIADPAAHFARAGYAAGLEAAAKVAEDHGDYAKNRHPGPCCGRPIAEKIRDLAKKGGGA